MSRKIVLCGAAVFTVAASLFVAPAHAAEDFPITVTPDEAHPGEKFTVSGTATEPTCAEDGVAVSLHYVKPNGDKASATVNTTTEADGSFTAEVTVPDIATAGEKSFVSAVIADCTPPDGETSRRTSESVDFVVQPYEGEFEISATKGEPGDILEFAGDNCWGGAVEFYFGPDDGLDGEPEEDKTFAGEFEIPDVPDGTYQVGAACPGTDYRVLSYRVNNPESAPPAAPPAQPIPRRPTFTG